MAAGGEEVPWLTAPQSLWQTSPLRRLRGDVWFPWSRKTEVRGFRLQGPHVRVDSPHLPPHHVPVPTEA